MATPASPAAPTGFDPAAALPAADWAYRLAERHVRWIQAIMRGREGAKGVTPREAVWRRP